MWELIRWMHVNVSTLLSPPVVLPHRNLVTVGHGGVLPASFVGPKMKLEPNGTLSAKSVRE